MSDNEPEPSLIICPCLCESNNNEEGSCIRNFIVLDSLVTSKNGEAFSMDNHIACRYYKCRVKADD